MKDFDFDVFISHASEDKATFVTPLAEALKKYGLKVWFDKFSLKVGDSLHDSIENGLARSRYGVVVLSRKFLSKKWPREELNGLFSRNLEGHKVILPVWHNVSAARVRSVLPMLADKFALRSTEGVDVVARALIKTIRPELLELDVRKTFAFEAGDSFISEARRKYPGYDFAVQSGSVTCPASHETKSAITKNVRKIEIRPADPAMIPPPGGKIQFYGEGAKKAIEFRRTGKPQRWGPGEFALRDWYLPLMPSNSEGGTLEVGKLQPPNAPTRNIRVEVGSPPVVVFPIMEIRPVRLGTHESELVISDKESPLEINLVFPFGSSGESVDAKEFELTLAWEGVEGKRVSECKKLIEAVDALRGGNELRLIDIRLDQLIFVSKPDLFDRADPFASDFRQMAFLTSQIEQEFLVPLKMPDDISQEDQESLFHLDCLLNGREYGTVEKAVLRMVRGEGEEYDAQLAFLRGEQPATFIDSPLDYPGYFQLLGQQVATREWVRVTEFIPAEFGANVEAFAEVPVGSEFNIEIAAGNPVLLRWKEDSVLKNIEVGKLTKARP